MRDLPLFRSRWAVIALVLLAVVLVFSISTGPSGRDAPSGSTYGTNAAGTAALASLLEQRGYEIEQRRISVAESPPDPGIALVVVNAGTLDEDDSAALESFVRRGGRLVVADTDPGFGVPEGRPVPQSPGEYSLALPHPAFAGVETVTAPYGLAWDDPAGLLPVFTAGGSTLVGVAAIGDGFVTAIADPVTIANLGLDEADNAALALAAVGPVDRVEFAEYVHGFGPHSGFAGLPWRWQWAVAGLAVAGLVFMLARSRRLGPPVHRDRELAPPRVRYVEALGSGMARTRDAAGAADLLREEIERLVWNRGIDPSDLPAIEGLAQRTGLDGGAITSALHPQSDGRQLKEMHGVLVALSRKD